MTMLAISVPMFLSFLAALIIAQYALRTVVVKFPESPAAQGLAALVL